VWNKSPCFLLPKKANNHFFVSSLGKVKGLAVDAFPCSFSHMGLPIDGFGNTVVVGTDLTRHSPMCNMRFLHITRRNGVGK
jgi:hypothetical protein